MKRLLLTLLVCSAAGVAIGVEPAPGDASADWWSDARERIADAEYEVTWQEQTVLADLDRAWHAPNRAHDLRTYFTVDEIRVVRRTAESPPWEWSLSLAGYGRGDAVLPVESASLAPDGKRIDYHRGTIVEWYVNDRRGLKQGFTLAAPPRGTRRDAGPAFLTMELGGTLSPAFSTDGQAIEFSAPGGARALHYAELKVVDARGETLRAWMEGDVESGTRVVRILFDDTDAVYPVTVDPLTTSPSWTAESDQAGAFLGIAVATAGDVNGDGYSDAVVGAYLYDNGQADEGAAFLYYGSPSGLSATADWSVESDQSGARLGRAVATAGDVNADGFSDVIVGAYLYDGGETDEGAAFVYHGSATGPSAVADWSVESNQAGARLAISVAPAGDVDGDGFSDVIVGAHLYDSGETDEGGAFCYLGSAGGLSTTAAWAVESNQADSRFGESVAGAGDVNADGYADVIVGAYLYDDGETDEGAAFLYLGSAGGPSTVADWTAGGDQIDASFGYPVSTAGDVNGDGYSDVIVGAQSYTNGEADEGRVFVYHGTATGLRNSADWTAESNQASAGFGSAAATAGDVDGDGYADVIVGAYLYETGASQEGGAFVYRGSASGLSTGVDWSVSSGQPGSSFGFAVSSAGDVDGDGYSDVIVGAYLYDNGEADEGRAFVYHGSPGGVASTPGWTVDGTQPVTYAYSVSAAGDVNGDGYGDIVVGAPDYDNGGRAFVYHGSPDGPAPTAAWTAGPGVDDASFGAAVSGAGDVNGDGHDDVVIGARWYSNPEDEEGRVFVYHGSAGGLSTTAQWSVEGDQAPAYLGEAVSAAGDVNGDGYDDVIVGASEFGNGQLGEGRAYVYHGSAVGLDLVASWTAEADQTSAGFGLSVSAVGDVNGDGYDDVIVGAPSFSAGATGDGRAFVYHGSPQGLGATAHWTAESAQSGADFGYSVSGAGDVNGDGFSDAIVGAWRFDGGEINEGRVWVYHGSLVGLSATPAWTMERDQTDSRFGISVSDAGDINGDGFADVIVGAYTYDNGETDEGRAYAFQGSATGLSTVPDWTAEGGTSNAWFGRSVSTAGDVNGDGVSDVIVGAPGYNAFEGRALLYYGNGGDGLQLTPQQRRLDDLAPIAAGGRSRDSGSLRLAATGRSPFGRGEARLELEVKPLGVPFDGAGTQLSPWVDTAVNGATFDEVVADLDPGAHHWRMRLLYDPVTTPLQRASRWFGDPWNGRQERDVTVSPFVGGTVWEDVDGDGIMQVDEPRLPGVLVRLLDGSGTPLQSTVSGGDGSYRFDVGSGGTLIVDFEPPADWSFTLRDRGIDDHADSDADTATGEAGPILPPFAREDEQRWSAGLRRLGICTAPDEEVYLYTMTIDLNGNAVLHVQDPNQPGDVTGYNVYRSPDPELPHAQWSLIASDVVDMDAAAPNAQWVDTSEDVSPSGSWYYQVAAYNHRCPVATAEGPW